MRTRPLATLAVLATAGAVALAGCGSSDNNKGGLGKGGSSGGGDTYTIAFQGPLSGDNQQLGINELDGYKLAIDQANAKGDLGFKLKTLTSDDVGDESKAPAAAAKVLQDKSVIAVMGPAFSGPTKAVGKTYGDAGIPMVSGSATNPLLSTYGFATFHRVVPSDEVEGIQAADWLAKRAKKVFVLNDLSEYGAGAAGVVAKQLKKDGVQVVTQGADAKGTKDYGPVAQAIVQSGAQAMFYGGYDAQAGQLAKALQAANYKGIKMGGNGVKSSVFTKGAGKAGDGWYFSCGCLDALTAPGAKDFTAAYKKAFNTDPSTYSPEAYDATNAIIEAIKEAKAAGSVTKQSVNDALNKLDYQGITTKVKFTPEGEIVSTEQVINLYQQKNGVIKVLGSFKDQK